MTIALLILNLIATGLVYMACYQTWRDVGDMHRDMKRIACDYQTPKDSRVQTLRPMECCICYLPLNQCKGHSFCGVLIK